MDNERTPGALGSNAELGPLPTPDVWDGCELSDDYSATEDWYTAEQMLAYGAQERAAERERWSSRCSAEIIRHRSELDRTGHQRHRGAADALERLLHECGPNAGGNRRA